MPAGVAEVEVELFGVPRLLARQASIRVPDGSLAEVARALLGRCPELAGAVIDPATGWLLDGYTFVVGERFSRDPAASIAPGDAVLLVASAAGG